MGVDQQRVWSGQTAVGIEVVEREDGHTNFVVLEEEEEGEVESQGSGVM